jgi:DNA-binding transcriptional ArsR family regulator
LIASTAAALVRSETPNRRLVLAATRGGIRQPRREAQRLAVRRIWGFRIGPATRPRDVRQPVTIRRISESILVLTFVSLNYHYDPSLGGWASAMMNAERVLGALGDRTRRRVFARLRNGTCSAGELARGMNVTRSAVSQHLQVLRAAGLVVVTADGTRRLYEVDRRGIEALRRWLDGFWDGTLSAFKAAAERAATKARRS